MRRARWNRQLSVLAAAGLTAAAVAAGAGPASAAGARSPAASPAGVPGPAVRLEAAQRSITVYSFRGSVVMDPGIWVESLGSALQFDVRRASYTTPVSITQVIRTPWGSVRSRRLPAAVLDGWNGLKHFIRMTVRDSAGKVVRSPWLTFCPDSFDPERTGPDSSATSPYPQACGQDPFPLSLVWGVAKGWAIDPAEDYPPSPLGPGPFMRLRPGKYQVTDAVGPAYVRLFRIPARAASATVDVTVAKTRGGSAAGPGRRGHAAGQAPRPPRVPYLADPPAAALPDLVPLPSWGISTSHARSGQDLLNFGATVWVGGNSPLDVEGFRVPGSPVMRAYQYFWRNGRIIGRIRAGTMGFADYNHWHFQQFARYALLDSAGKLAVPSHKEGFCIAPSDPVDLLAPHAVWQPPAIGLAGQCGQPTALWVREMLPDGWGDTYFQTVPGESFDITRVPNGRYYIEVIANPERVLHETTTRNDVSLRKVILGGAPGHRTVTVPPWHGIDPEP